MSNGLSHPPHSSHENTNLVAALSFEVSMCQLMEICIFGNTSLLEDTFSI